VFSHNFMQVMDVIKKRALACGDQGGYPGLAEKLSWANILRAGASERNATDTMQRITEPLYSGLKYERLVSCVRFRLCEN
jgi:hypothetical protein